MTYSFENGSIWRWSYGPTGPAFITDRDMAERIRQTFETSASVGDWFAPRAAELAAGMAEAIRQYDEQFDLRKVA